MILPTFTSTPKIPGLWLHVVFKDGYEFNCTMVNDLSYGQCAQGLEVILSGSYGQKPSSAFCLIRSQLKSVTILSVAFRPGGVNSNGQIPKYPR